MTKDLAVKVDGDVLHIGAVTISFQRTLRIPDDGSTYPLPPGLGAFPIRRVQDYAARVPDSWRAHGGVFLPMYQREAMWLRFGGRHWKPNALKVGVGKVCALTGERWSEKLSDDPQDYCVVPAQPWIDGINNGDDTIRQFIAMPLGMGYTVEGQVTGEERHGGLQLCVFEPKPGRFPDEPPPPPVTRMRAAGAFAGAPMMADMAMPAAAAAPPAPSAGMEMGLGAGGRMRQTIYDDPHGLDAWDQSRHARVFVHLCNSMLWREITGEAPPDTPVSARTYTEHGYPWYELYDEGRPGIGDATDALQGVKSVKDMDAAKGFTAQQDDGSVDVPGHKVTKLDPPPLAPDKNSVVDGTW